MRDVHEYLRGLNEDQLRNIVILPLLKKMGLHGVIEYHGGAPEKGKDIIGYYEGPLGDRHYVAVVAKAADIHGAVAKRGSAAEVLIQVEQALNEPYTDVYDLKEIRFDECWVITSGEIKNTAIESIRGKLVKSNLDKVVRFIDRSKIIELISEHMPSFWYSEYMFLRLTHELKAILVSVVNNSYLLRGRAQAMPQEKLERRLDDIEADAKSALHLIESFSLGQLSDFHMISERIAYKRDVILKVISNVRAENRTRVRLQLPLEMESIWLTGDRNLLRHAIASVLDNALKYSVNEVIIEGRIEKGTVILTISDSGIGIPSGLEEQVFQPGFRAANALTGVGMGLSVAQKIFRQHEGDVKLLRNSDPTQFELYLPYDNSFRR